MSAGTLDSLPAGVEKRNRQALCSDIIRTGLHSRNYVFLNSWTEALSRNVCNISAPAVPCLGGDVHMGKQVTFKLDYHASLALCNCWTVS